MSSPFIVRPSDAPQRRRAIDPGESFLVQAPAGSGKTELLIQRYLRLLAIVEKPERIQAITFTRKAAGEMRERIILSLERASTGEVPTEPHERGTYELALAVLARDSELQWGLLQNPARMKLQTIDSLCAGIVAQMPWLARQGSPPVVLEDATALYLKAAQNTVMMVEQPGHYREHLERLLSHLDNNSGKVADLISSMLATREQWIREAVGIGDDSRDRMEFILTVVTAEAFRAVDKLFPRDDLKLLHRLIPGDWREVVPVLLTADSKRWRKRLDKNCGFETDCKEDKADCAELIGRLKEIPELREALALIKSLPPQHYTEEQWLVTRSIFECLKLAVAQLRLVFQEAGVVDFSEIAQAAQYALGNSDNPSDLALKLDARIDHLLIDEFQDTSESQFTLVKTLIEGWEQSDGRTIFLVGDPMQSIYRFRQAEVGLFLETRDAGIGTVTPESLVLDANYRSVNSIVEWVNRVFATIFPGISERETGAISYSKSRATLPGEESAVHLHPFAEDEEILEAEKVIELIQEAREADPAGTVAILVRARTHLPSIVDQLKRAGLSFRAVDIDELGERAVVRDLLSLTRAMLHLGDRLSWLAILRAPWCGMTLAELHTLAGADPKALVYDLLRTGHNTSRLLTVMEAAFKNRGRVPLRSWVEQTWRNLGGPWCYGEGAAQQDAADYLDLLEREQVGSDLPDFDNFARQVTKLNAKADPNANEWLQVMTIHKAKGLQFDTVILPGLGRPARRDDSKLFLFHRGLIAPIKETSATSDPIYVYLAEIEKRRCKHEVVRQLYVAVTRAKKRIHLLGAAQAGKAETKPVSGSLLDALWSGLTAEERQLFIERAAVLPEAAAKTFRSVPLQRLPEGWEPPPAQAPVQVLASGFEVIEPEQPTFEWVGDSLRYAGTVVHELLQRMARSGLRQIDSSLIRRALLQAGVPANEMNRTLVQVESAVQRIVTSPKGQWILAPRAGARSEMPVTGVVDGKTVRGKVDRTFVDEAGIRWVIDFKTSDHRGGELELFLDEQQRRYSEQLERYARLLVHMGQPIRLGLYFPLLDEWREWELN